MPRVTININAPNEATDPELLTLDLPPGLTIKDLKGMVEAETTFPASAQHFFLNGQKLNAETQTLEEAGIKDGEMVAVLIRRAGTNPAPRRAPNTAGGVQPPTVPAGQPEPEEVRLRVLSDPKAQESLRDSSPELFAVLQDPARWRETYINIQNRAANAEGERQRQIALLNEDPFNIDAQRKIEEIIRQDRVIENLQHAYEHNPEVFARVHMLYINTEVNGHPVKAFVDSGAQATIMSPSCAESCGIMRLIDTRYSGMARGVGTARILGRVHHAEIKIAGAIMPCAFTVMEGKDVDLLFGLDMLKRYKAKIDLEKNALCFSGIEVPFLPEHEIPKQMEEAALNEPTIPGPNGTEISSVSGTVRQKGTTDGATSSTESGPSTTQQPAVTSQSSPDSTEKYPPEHVEQLISFGFTRQMAIQALQATGGNVEYAAQLLLDWNQH